MKQYQGTWKSFNKNTYSVELWRGATGSDETRILKIARAPEIKIEGTDNTIYESAIKPSTATVGFIMRDSNDKTNFENFHLDPEDTWAMKIYKNGSLYFVGRVLADEMNFVRRNRNGGYDEVQVVAVDALNRLEGYDIDPTWFTIDTDKRISILSLIKKMIDKTGLSSYWGNSDMFISDAIAHSNANQTTGEHFNFYSVHKLNFVQNINPFLSSEKVQWRNCKDALEGILKSFTAWIIQSNGSYWIYQPAQCTQTSLSYTGYDKSLNILVTPPTFTLSYTANATDERPTFEAFPNYDYQPPVRQVDVDIDRRFGIIASRTTLSSATFNTHINEVFATNANPNAGNWGRPIKIIFSIHWVDIGVLGSYYKFGHLIEAFDSNTSKYYHYDSVSGSWIDWGSSFATTFYYGYDQIDHSIGIHGDFTYSKEVLLPEPPMDKSKIYVSCNLIKVVNPSAIVPSSGSAGSPGAGRVIKWGSPISTNHPFVGTIEIIQAYNTNQPFEYEQLYYYHSSVNSPGDNNSVKPELKCEYYNGRNDDVGSIEVYNGSAWVNPGNWTVGWSATPNGDLPQVMADTIAALYSVFLPKIKLKLWDNGNYLPINTLSFDSKKWLLNSAKFNLSDETWDGEWLGISTDYSVVTSNGDGLRTTKKTSDYLYDRLAALEKQMAKVMSNTYNFQDTFKQKVFYEATNAPSVDPGVDKLYNIQLAYNAANATMAFQIQEKGATDWTTVVKKAAETITSDTTLSADAELTFDMLANTTYAIRMKVYFDTIDAADFKYSLTGPAAPIDVRVQRKHIAPGSSTTIDAVDIAYTSSVPITGTGTDGGFIDFDMVVENGPNAGAFAFNWAQNTGDAGDTTVRKGSFLEYMVIPEVASTDDLLIESGDFRLLESGDRRLLG